MVKRVNAVSLLKKGNLYFLFLFNFYPRRIEEFLDKSLNAVINLILTDKLIKKNLMLAV
jgi:hypothetical protein